VTIESSEPGRADWEIVYEPGIQVGWALRIDEVPLAPDQTDAADDTTARSHASTLLDVEQAVADRVAECGDAVARIVHTFGGRDVHLRDGSRLQCRWEPVISDWRCLDCGVDTDAINEYYMVLDSIWEQATNGLEGHLCIECLERRLGRALYPSDFSTRNINTDPSTPRSTRLATRLAKAAPVARHST
jgi:hypothetical protein